MKGARRLVGARGPASPTGSARESGRRSGRACARFFRPLPALVLPALALLLGALSPFAAAPVSAEVLVSNIGESSTSTESFLVRKFAQEFTTGSNAKGYNLTSIEFNFSLGVSAPSRLFAEVWPVKADGSPDERQSMRVVALNVPSSIPAGTVAFTAPANTVLAADTSYFVAIGAPDGTRGTITFTNSDNEQKATGWSIANNGYTSAPSWGSTWSALRANALCIRVNGTPVSTKTYAIQSSASAIESLGAALTVTLGENAPAGGLTLNVTYDYSAGSAIRSDLGTTLFNRIVVPPGSKTRQLTVPFKSDDVVEGDETFKVKLSTSAAGWRKLSNTADTATVTITDDDDDSAKIAFGTNAQATTKYTVSVNENLTGGSLSVPVTVSHLPGASTTFDIEVLGAGTATESADYRIATKSVTFGPTSNKTQNLTVALINDALGENAETVELRIKAADDPVNDLGDHYARNANGSTATVTINSEDAPHAPANLRVTPGKEGLSLSWDALTGVTLTRYDVHYTSAPTTGDGAVGNDDAASGADPKTAWVVVSRPPPDLLKASHAITSLEAGTTYRLRVRAVSRLGNGVWVCGERAGRSSTKRGSAAGPGPAAGTIKDTIG